MVETVASLSGMGKIFAGSAVLGGCLFLVRLVLQFLGGDGGNGDAAGAHDGLGDTDASFKLLSFQGLTAFFMMFGLVGLALDQSGAAAGLAILGALAAGAGSVWLISKLFSSLIRLQSSGTLDLANAVGQEGSVYLRVPASGTGKVQVVVQGRLTMIDAVSDAGEELPTGTRVTVVRVVGGDVVVKRL
ncbi:MAG: hypothetical protein HZB55_00815 [Deltaproteobacteria bacterium]|nr:hypothetical protein [Deltaproteobacteria bacterium]